MRKSKFLFLLLLFSSIFAHGQTNDRQYKKKYFNMGFVYSTLDQEGMSELKSNYGASVTLGRTFYLHKKPLAKLVKFGIDVTWFDITYTNYDVKYITFWNEQKFQVHEGEFAMQIGPSITINPTKNFNVQGYFRFAPSFSGYYDEKEFRGNYVSFWVGGCSISYKSFGIGIESRLGKGNYEMILPIGDKNLTDKFSLKTKGYRAYLTFKF